MDVLLTLNLSYLIGFGHHIVRFNVQVLLCVCGCGVCLGGKKWLLVVFWFMFVEHE